mmetsp:Transcript_74549/g.216233  ORF Transcript_74549/g.216233 Transcript_74549/m.216233 type:complete len:248 (+) Transcript_74549:102-845(+)
MDRHGQGRRQLLHRPSWPQAARTWLPTELRRRRLGRMCQALRRCCRCGRRTMQRRGGRCHRLHGANGRRGVLLCRGSLRGRKEAQLLPLLLRQHGADLGELRLHVVFLLALLAEVLSEALGLVLVGRPLGMRRLLLAHAVLPHLLQLAAEHLLLERRSVDGVTGIAELRLEGLVLLVEVRVFLEVLILLGPGRMQPLHGVVAFAREICSAPLRLQELLVQLFGLGLQRADISLRRVVLLGVVVLELA